MRNDEKRLRTATAFPMKISGYWNMDRWRVGRVIGLYHIENSWKSIRYVCRTHT